MFWSYSVWTLCAGTGRDNPVAFSLDARLARRRKVTSDAVNLVRSPRLRRSWALPGTEQTEPFRTSSQARTHTLLREGYQLLMLLREGEALPLVTDPLPMQMRATLTLWVT